MLPFFLLRLGSSPAGGEEEAEPKVRRCAAMTIGMDTPCSTTRARDRGGDGKRERECVCVCVRVRLSSSTQPQQQASKCCRIVRRAGGINWQHACSAAGSPLSAKGLSPEGGYRRSGLPLYPKEIALQSPRESQKPATRGHVPERRMIEGQGRKKTRHGPPRLASIPRRIHPSCWRRTASASWVPMQSAKKRLQVTGFWRAGERWRRAA